MGPRRHMTTENFGHHLTSMCSCCMGKPSNGNQMFLVPLIFFCIKGLLIFRFPSFSSWLVPLLLFLTISVIRFKESKDSMHYFVLLLWFQIWSQILFNLLRDICRWIMLKNQVEGEIIEQFDSNFDFEEAHA